MSKHYVPLKSKGGLQCLCILLYFFLNCAHAELIQIAVASNFILPAQEIAKQFENETGNKVKISSGSSGKFFAQIINGAPFHVLLSADADTPTKLVKQGFAVEHSQRTYAVGKLVLWSSRPDLITDGETVLTNKRFNKIAIANPELAPYGRAAVETLVQSGQYQLLKSKIVWGENIAQTHQFVLSGNAELGFVSASQIMRDGKVTQGSAWLVPESMHAPILQDAVLLSKAIDSVAAQQFLNYLSSDRARSIIQQFGYGTPSK